MAPVTDALLAMAYGTPSSLDDVEAYYTDIRGGRPPSPELLAELTGRYRAIGGRSPLLDITFAQANGAGAQLNMKAYVGQKHATPFIADAMAQVAADSVDRLAGLVLAPHYSDMSVGDYERRARLAAEKIGWNGELVMINSWFDDDALIELLAGRVRDAIAQLPQAARDDFVVLFTAHSLPVKILESGDPYPQQLERTAELVAARAGIERWQVAWQSAGRTPDPWLGPDLLEVLVELGAKGVKGVVVCPCGFVADHLEVLYDVDIEAKILAAELDMELVRTASPNDDPAFIDVLAGVVRRALG